MIGLAIEMTRSSWTMDQITELYALCFQPDRKVYQFASALSSVSLDTRDPYGAWAGLVFG